MLSTRRRVSILDGITLALTSEHCPRFYSPSARLVQRVLDRRRIDTLRALRCPDGGSPPGPAGRRSRPPQVAACVRIRWDDERAAIAPRRFVCSTRASVDTRRSCAAPVLPPVDGPTARDEPRARCNQRTVPERCGLSATAAPPAGACGGGSRQMPRAPGRSGAHDVERIE